MAELTSQVAPKVSFTKNSRAYLLAICAYQGIFIFGYDTGVGGGVIALPSFVRDFGLSGSPTYVANTQGNVVSILQGGCFFGALLGAPLTTRIGRKLALQIECAVFLVGAVIQTSASTSLPQFYVGRFVCGLAVGGMSMVCPTYVTELAPREIRGRITG
jgi:MFS family permease